MSSVRVLNFTARGGMEGRERDDVGGILSVSGGGGRTCRLDEVRDY